MRKAYVVIVTVVLAAVLPRAVAAQEPHAYIGGAGPVRQSSLRVGVTLRAVF
jgi:hypothetical protein